MCGVMRQFLAIRSRWSGGGGSTVSTSKPAPARRPEFSASARAGSSPLQARRPPRCCHLVSAGDPFCGNTSWRLASAAINRVLLSYWHLAGYSVRLIYN